MVLPGWLMALCGSGLLTLGGLVAYAALEVRQVAALQQEVQELVEQLPPPPSPEACDVREEVC